MSNNIDYIKGYNKEHYVRLQVYLKPDEMEELEKELNRLGLTKSQFIKDAIKELKKKK